MNDLVRSHLLRQAGTVSREQARAAGVTDRQISGLLARREWLRVHPGVFRLHASVPLPETGAWAASLWLGPGAGITLIDRAKQTRVVRQNELERAFGRHPGCWGSSTIRTLLARTGGKAHSELERLAVTLLRKAGITGFEPNLTVGLSGGRSVEIDIAFPDRRIAIELDGFAYHSSAESFRTDLRRANALMKDGWTARRFGWDDLVNDPDGVVAAIVELLAL